MNIQIAPAAVAGICPMLTDAEVAALLKTSPWVVQKMARNMVLPGARKVGRRWMFRRNEIARFVEGK